MQLVKLNISKSENLLQVLISADHWISMRTIGLPGAFSKCRNTTTSVMGRRCESGVYWEADSTAVSRPCENSKCTCEKGSASRFG